MIRERPISSSKKSSSKKVFDGSLESYLPTQFASRHNGLQRSTKPRHDRQFLYERVLLLVGNLEVVGCDYILSLFLRKISDNCHELRHMQNQFGVAVGCEPPVNVVDRSVLRQKAYLEAFSSTSLRAGQAFIYVVITDVVFVL